ncbi:hypothetical protein B0H19DRAFT_1266857 [Mycena capillaripes]|nr:hypothetical protein B0H19DRAFT_1266857 [Mycena capillaripes]
MPLCLPPPLKSRRSKTSPPNYPPSAVSTYSECAGTSHDPIREAGSGLLNRATALLKLHRHTSPSLELTPTSFEALLEATLQQVRMDGSASEADVCALETELERAAAAFKRSKTTDRPASRATAPTRKNARAVVSDPRIAGASSPEEGIKQSRPALHQPEMTTSAGIRTTSGAVRSGASVHPRFGNSKRDGRLRAAAPSISVCAPTSPTFGVHWASPPCSPVAQAKVVHPTPLLGGEPQRVAWSSDVVPAPGGHVRCHFSTAPWALPPLPVRASGVTNSTRDLLQLYVILTPILSPPTEPTHRRRSVVSRVLMARAPRDAADLARVVDTRR